MTSYCLAQRGDEMITDSLLTENIILPVQQSNKDRRVSERLAAGKEIKFFLGNVCYSGTALNFSSQGLFISTDVTLSINAQFEVIIFIENNIIKESVRVVRTSKQGHYYRGIGVILERPSVEYMDFIDRF
jgi:hypothetical protein